MNDEHVELLSDIPLFQELELNDINIINEHLSTIELQAGETVFEEGDEGTYVCFIIFGELDIIKRTINGNEKVISRLARGRSLGEMSLIDNLPRSATVKASSNTTLFVLTSDEFEKILISSPQIGIKILKYISRALSLNLRRTSNVLLDGVDG